MISRARSSVSGPPMTVAGLVDDTPRYDLAVVSSRSCCGPDTLPKFMPGGTKESLDLGLAGDGRRFRRDHTGRAGGIDHQRYDGRPHITVPRR